MLLVRNTTSPREDGLERPRSRSRRQRQSNALELWVACLRPWARSYAGKKVSAASKRYVHNPPSRDVHVGNDAHLHPSRVTGRVVVRAMRETHAHWVDRLVTSRCAGTFSGH